MMLGHRYGLIIITVLLITTYPGGAEYTPKFKRGINGGLECASKFSQLIAD